MTAQVLIDKQCVRIEGALDFHTAMDVRAQLQRALQVVQGDMVLDLAGVEHANSVGLSLILLLARGLEARNSRLQIQNMPAGLQSIARVCELEDWLDGLAA